MKQHARQDIVILLVGNKLDICEKNPMERKVSQQKAEEFAQKNGLIFMETSAFNDINVKDSFEILVQEIYNLNQREDLNNRRVGGVKIHNDPNFKSGNSMCGCSNWEPPLK